MGLGLDLAALKQKLVPAAPGAPVAKPKVQVARQQRQVANQIQSSIASPAEYVAEHLSNEEKLALVALGYKGTADFVDDVIRALIDQQLSEFGFDADPAQVAQTVSAQAIEKSFELAKLMLKISSAAREASKAISDIQDFSLLYVLTNEKNHIAQLLQPNLVSVTGLARLARLPIYLQASKMRMQKLVENSERDRVAELELNEALVLFEKAGGQIPLAANSEPKIIETRWMLEELRVSLFAQSLGTAQSVSVQRIKKALGDN
jgi:ATP-dependent helicase HrpA